MSKKVFYALGSISRADRPDDRRPGSRSFKLSGGLRAARPPHGAEDRARRQRSSQAPGRDGHWSGNPRL